MLGDGFYEWANRPGEKLKVPYYFRLKDKSVYGFAGLRDLWRHPTGKTELLTFCLITTTPNEVVEPRYYSLWLSQKEQPVERLTHQHQST